VKRVGIIVGIVAVIIIIVVIVMCTGPRDSAFQIKVSGTEGLFFSGSYLVITADGQSISKSVDSLIPAEYSVTGTMVSVTFQKQTEDGFLKVEIIKDGEVLADEYTIAAYGIVSIATD
jgi:hypothetical protein